MLSGQRSEHTPPVPVSTQMPLLHCALSVHVSPKPSIGPVGDKSGIGSGASAMSSSSAFPPTPVPRSHSPPPQCDGLSAAAQPSADKPKATAANAAPFASSFMARSIQPFAVTGSTDFGRYQVKEF